MDKQAHSPFFGDLNTQGRADRPSILRGVDDEDGIYCRITDICSHYVFNRTAEQARQCLLQSLLGIGSM